MPAMFLFVLEQLAIQFVRERIDGRVHVFVFGVRKQIAAGDMDIGFGAMYHFFYSEGYMRGGDLVEMALQTLQFIFYVVFEGAGNLEMVTSNGELHSCFLFEVEIGQAPRREPGRGTYCLILDQSLALVGRRNKERVAVFRDGASGDFNALLLK